MPNINLFNCSSSHIYAKWFISQTVLFDVFSIVKEKDDLEEKNKGLEQKNEGMILLYRKTHRADLKMVMQFD